MANRRQSRDGYLSGPALDSSFMNRGREHRPSSRQDSGSLIGWTLIFLALGAWTLVSWTLPFDVDAHPERPLYFDLLQKVGKIEPFRSYGPDRRPEGQCEFLDAPGLAAKVQEHAGENALPDWNGALMRNYVFHYPAASDSPFFHGEITIDSVEALRSRGFFPSGILVRGRAPETPSLQFEILYSTKSAAKNPDLGPTLRFEKTASYAAVLRVERNASSPGWIVTLVPLAYPALPIPGGGSLPGAPPSFLNMRTAWPQSSISQPFSN